MSRRHPCARPTVEHLEDRVTPALHVQFDYRFDTTGFFGDPLRRQVLQAAADDLTSHLHDRLDAIAPGGGNTWTASLNRPDTNQPVQIPDLVVPADTLIVFVGAQSLSNSHGFAAPLAIPAFGGTREWYNTLLGRGQPGALLPLPTDTASLGGYIAFNSNLSWYFGTATPVPAGLPDFYTRVQHGLGHALGFYHWNGETTSFDRLLENGAFHGPNVIARHGGPVPVRGRYDWDFGVRDNGQLTGMGSEQPNGTRVGYTPLDYAALADIGWELTPPPAPTAAPPNLRVTGVVAVDEYNNPRPTPYYGEEVFVRVEWEEVNVPASQTYTIRATVNGIPLECDPLAGSASGSRHRWALLFGPDQTAYGAAGWHLPAGTFTAQVSLDPAGAVAEGDESDNAGSATITTRPPTTLPAKLVSPVGGVFGIDWTIDDLIDVDPRAGSAVDYRGGPFITDGHTGWHAALANYAKQDAGVPLYAAAAGTVTRVDEGQYDRWTIPEGHDYGRNRIYIDIGNGWSLYYTHVGKNTVTVKAGDHVEAGQLIALLAASGSDHPHLHFFLEYNGLGNKYSIGLVEPFLSPADYFADPHPYAGDLPVGLLASSVTNYDPTSNTDRLDELSRVGVFPVGSGWTVWTAWGVTHRMPGDVLRWKWYRPDGTLHQTQTSTTSALQRGPNWSYRTLSAAGWSSYPGAWQVVFEINGVELGRESFQVVAAGLGQPELRLTQGATYIIHRRTTPLDFGSATLGGSPPQLVFSVNNHGAAALTLSGIALPPGYSLVGTLPSSVAAGATATFTLQMNTSKAGYWFGAVTLTTNDADAAAFTFILEGRVTGALPAGSPVLTDTLPTGAITPATGFTVGQVPQLLFAFATLTDTTSPTLSGGRVTAEFAAGFRTGDALGIRNQGTGAGQVGVSGATVTFGGTPIGTAAGGSGGTPLVVTLNASATPTAVQALIRALTYATTVPSPGSSQRFVRLTVTDDTGLTSDQVVRVAILMAPVTLPPNPPPPPNTPPTISDLPHRWIQAGTGTGPMSITIGDAETLAASLTLFAWSSDTVLVPAGGIVFGGSGANRTITVAPAAGRAGAATIAVVVTDGGGLSATDTFVLAVTPPPPPPNTPPTISDVADRSVPQNGTTGAIPVTVADAETPAGSLTLTAQSSNTALVPAAGITLAGSGANRTVAVTPAAGQSGTVTITLTVQDGGGQTAVDMFVLTVVPPPPNTPPTISDV
ncbi:MAG TPA: choice-of-anchor D domain-containing protein, partial [Gemmataceae bacterium]|nr:choice-of-anchor D domain-containing protein [Gemmataceae bacterium]